MGGRIMSGQLNTGARGASVAVALEDVSGKPAFCNVCGSPLNSWDKRCSKALAYKYPNCEKCIAKEYDIDVDVFRDHMEEFFGMRPCVGI